MGHRHTQVTGNMIDEETIEQQGPCIFYGSLAPHTNIHSMVPSPGSQCNFNPQRMPEHRGSTLFYGTPQYNPIQPQHPVTNLGLTIGSPSNYYNPYLGHPSGIRDFSIQANQESHDRLSLSATHGIAIPKRKNVEEAPANYLHHTALAGPSSSVTPMITRPPESDIIVMDSGYFNPPEYIGNDQASIVESGSLRSARNRPVMIGPESVLAHNSSHLIPGNYVAPHVQWPGNPWMQMHFGANSGDGSTIAWTQASSLPFVNAGVNGACVEAGNIGMQGYQVTAGNGSSTGFMHPPIPQGHPSPHLPTQPMQGVRGYNVNFQPQMATTSRRIPMIGSSNITNHFQNVVDAVPAFLAPVPPTGFRVYQPHRRQIVLGSDMRQRGFPHLRDLPEDEVAILEIPGYQEAVDSLDQHRDMRLDIDHMSYEELLALGEQIGSVGTGLSEEFIENNLKIRTFTSSSACLSLGEAPCLNQQINLCVICQVNYEGEEKIGTLDCGHEYHTECIKKWLAMKNACPVCKSTALSGKGKDL